MALEKKKFVNYTLNEELGSGKTISKSIKLNVDEQEQILKDMEILNQAKLGTAIKQLMAIGSKVIHDQKNREIMEIILGNKRKNKRLGIVDFD